MTNALFTELKNEDGTMFVGHSSALVKMGSDLILFDGVWGEHNPYENFLFYPKQKNCAEYLPLLTAAITSHCHADHWSADILEAMLCPVHVMDGRPKLVERLSEHTPVVEVSRLEWVRLTKETWVYFIPNPKNTVDSSCLLRRGDFCVYLGSDNFLDRNLCQKVANAAGSIDVAYTPWQFIHYYPALMEMDESKRIEEALRLKKQALDQARMFFDIVRPKMAVPFGGNLLYCEGPNHPLNAFIAKPEELYQGTPMNAGDYILKENGRLVSYCFPLKEKPEWRSLPPMDFRVELSDAEHLSIIDRVRGAHRNAPGHAITVNDCVTIDADQRRVYAGASSAILRDRRVHSFSFDASVFHAWASGNIPFEAALGSRRFKYSRNPNEFDSKLADWWENFL